MENKGNPIALLPIGVFLVLYLGLGIIFEYILGIEMGFYNIPIIAVFLVAILVACLQNRSMKFDYKMLLMGQGNRIAFVFHVSFSSFRYSTVRHFNGMPLICQAVAHFAR